MKVGFAVSAVVLTAIFPLSSFGQGQATPDLVAEFLRTSQYRPSPERPSADDPFPLPELPATWEYREAAPRRSAGVEAGELDFLVAAPGGALGSLAGGLRSLGNDTGPWTAPGDSGGTMIARVLGSLNAPATPFSVHGLTEDLFDREAKYLRQRPNPIVVTPDFDDGEEDVGFESVSRDQRKVLRQTLGRYYLGPYSSGFNESVRREAFDLSCWNSTDFVIGPMVLAGYLYWRGWDTGVRWGDLECRLNFVAGERMLDHRRSTDDYLVSAGSLELAVGGFPVKLIVSGGILAGDPVLDFVGIGTSVSVVRRAVKLEVNDPQLLR